MSKFFVNIIILFLFVVTVCCLQAEAQSSGQKVILQGGVETNVPRTPTEVTVYLKKMNIIMKEYESLSNRLASVLMSGGQSPEVASSARKDWIRIANKIDSIAPPVELKISHRGLANSLRKSSTFLTSMSGVSADQKQQVLMGLIPVVSDLGSAVTIYSTQVDNVCDEYGLSRSLNPISKNGAFNSTGLGSNMNINAIMNGLGGASMGF